MSLSFTSMSMLLLTFYIRSLHAAVQRNNVLTLTKENFTQTIAKEIVFINFCTPWCGHCMKLAEEFDQAAEKAIQRYPTMKFAKVDVSSNDELAKEQNVHAYPTLRLYRNKIPVVYNSGPKADDIIAWLVKKQEPAVRHLRTLEAIRRFQEEHPIVVVGIFKDLQTQKAQNFYSLASEMTEYPFAVISEKRLITSFTEETDNILLFRHFDEQKLVYNGPNDLKKLKHFIEVNSLPLIVEFGHQTASKILRGPTKAILLFFILNEGDQLGRCVTPLRDLAITYRGQILFVTITYDDKDKKRAYDHFGIMKSETPRLRLIEFDEKDELITYKPNIKEISLKAVDNFIQQYIEGSLMRYYKSEILPDNWNGNDVIILVGRNFWNFILDRDRTVLVVFLAPWCFSHCKPLESIIENLAQKFRDNTGFFVAKIDATSNEIENLKISVFPTIKLFSKDNEQINYEGARTTEGLEIFLAQNDVHYDNRDEL